MVKKSSKPPPFTILTVSVAHDDYKQLDDGLTALTSTAQIAAIADTGHQSCLMEAKL